MFKKLDINDRDIYQRFIKNNNFFTCEYSFSTLYMWRKANLLQYKIIKDIFIVKKNDLDYGSFFMEPLGIYSDEQLIDLISCLEEIRKRTGMPWLFGNLTKEFIDRVKSVYEDNIIIEEEENHFDYIYESERLIDLKGKDYRNKRNKINQFSRENIYSLNVRGRNIQNKELEQYREFLEKWNSNYNCKDSYLEYEIESIEDLLNNIEELNLKVVELYSKGELIGFSIGEIFNEILYIVHVEKCLRDFNGAYAFLNNKSLKLCCENQKFVNREEDLGIIGLREAKMSYKPIFLEKKYLLKLKNETV